jgi:hypothetical protein
MTIPLGMHYDTLVDKPCIVEDEQGVPVVGYFDLEGDAGKLLAAVQALQYGYADRSSGMMSQSKVLGYQPRIGMRRDYCHTAVMSRENPAEHDLLLEWAARVTKVYAATCPERFQKQMAQLDKVRPEWRIPNSAFTSGIVNKDNNLLYHYDAGNFSDVWSCMIVLQRDMHGGHLVVPRYGMAFAFPRPALIMFDGMRLLHGVFPMVAKSKLSYRYSIVYYALRQMCNCLSPQKEIERIRVLKTERELKRSKKE